MVATLRPEIETTSAQLHERAGETFEYVQAISAPLNARVLGSMFGVPDGDFLALRHWLDDFFVRDEVAAGHEPRQVIAMRELRAYVDALVEQRTRQPGPDLISAMLVAGEDGTSLSAEQVSFTTMTFLTAGFESTNNLLTNMVAALAAHQHLLPVLQSSAAAREAFVEETMRWDAAAQGFVRTPTREVQLHDALVPEGAQVLVHLGAANRDPEAFDDPDRFDLDRSSNRHLGLGHGAHFCVGAPLGRALASFALSDLVRTTRHLDIDLASSDRVITPNFRGFQRLAIRRGVTSEDRAPRP
jgi:cytochrome P450